MHGYYSKQNKAKLRTIFLNNFITSLKRKANIKFHGSEITSTNMIVDWSTSMYFKEERMVGIGQLIVDEILHDSLTDLFSLCSMQVAYNWWGSQNSTRFLLFMTNPHNHLF